MQNYLDLLSKTIEVADLCLNDRTKVGTYRLFGQQLRFDLAKGFPLVTTKRVHMKSVIYELLWFLSGSTNVNDLRKHGVTIWDEWADADGEIGPAYGHQWRHWGVSERLDQISDVITTLRHDPQSRRHLVTAWNPDDVPFCNLPPCHCLFQFFVSKGQLSCQVYQRSADLFLGVPFNIASYAALTMMVAQVTNLVPAELIFTFGDSHIYLNHLSQVALQLNRIPRQLPSLIINPDITNIFEFRYEDFSIVGYNPHEAIKAPVAV